MQDQFREKLFSDLLRDCHSHQEHNIDYAIFPATRLDRWKRMAKDKALAILSARGFVRRFHDVPTPARALISTVGRLDRLERAYYLLGDDHSRQTFLDVLRYKILGPRHVKLALNTPRFWEEYNSIDKRFLRERKTLPAQWGWDFHLYEPEEGLRLHGNASGVLATFRLEQYAYRDRIRAREGDVVIDGGAFIGDTGLYFAARVGPEGKVYAFEFEERGLEILGKNLALNPHLSDRIRVVPHAMWCESDRPLGYEPNGPATTVALRESGEASVTTLSIDDLVKGEGLVKVDFVKMDIEGAELSALKGAEATLRAFRPTLAISVYHREEDFAEIPAYINSLGLGYEFYLEHFTVYACETILFAVHPSRAQKKK
ncbi:MAG: FkbM family methyltransferase [Pyrinomonadaceae bacterium]